MSGGEICDDSNVANGDACNPACNLTNVTSVFAGQTARPGGAGGLAIFADVLWYADTTNRVIWRIDLATEQGFPVAGDASVPMGPPVDAPVGVQARFQAPRSLATDGTTVWITDFQSLRAMTVAPPHAVTTVAGSASFGPDTYRDGVGTDAGLPDPRGATFHDGKVYFTDAIAATVRRFDPTSLEVVTIAGTPYEISYLDGIGAAARFVSPRNTTMVGAGLLFVSDTNGSAIRTLDLETLAVGTFAGNGTAGYVDGIGLDARVGRPRGLTSDGTSVYWAESTGQTVRQGIIETASVSTLAGPPCEQDPCEGAYAEGVGMQARFSLPFDVVYHPGSNSLFVLDAGNEVIRRIR